jgi:carbonic anhydrase
MPHKLAFAALGVVLLTANGSDDQHHWSYTGAEGPSHWEGACATGKNQSPIDLSTRAAKHGNLPALTFAYKPTPLHVIDNGHSIQVDVDKGSSLTVEGAQYALVQFHFHKPSEETIDGKHFAMVVHLVHKDAAGKLAVVAVPLEAGAANPLIATVWKNLPKEKGHSVAPAGVTIDPSQLVPANRTYFTYTGSLTTPPCTEGVRWFVLTHPTAVSGDEIASFAKLYPANARPPQPLNGRPVRESE